MLKLKRSVKYSLTFNIFSGFKNIFAKEEDINFTRIGFQ